LKTVEEVEKERIKALDAVMSQVKVARKLVQRGVSCQIEEWKEPSENQ